MDEVEARRRFATSTVARLATVDASGRPTLVPICFALEGEVIYSAVDDKPKTTTQLARLANVHVRPDVAVLADHYGEDWTALWWVRARGIGRELDDGAERHRAIELLRAKYPQYAQHALDGPVLAIDVSAWRGWSATPPA
ncbi:MAG: TIGR03668 family PPOX class F420-dependent oxidoreductase [Actinobacteria bacterium]|nr:TIGR03668 family PPOX class F420-dependent oxidoreductase [Actinomycetota bacterium]MBV9933903.1 TIGR03668 family PPOX class F420-dependent oxidoreductase [Actinomycetota bacterium]